MSKTEKPLLQAFKGIKNDSPPFWFMRQAGRYLPEYKELRKTTKGFLDFCYTPEKASEATLQPIKRFGMSGAIIFSDILVIPHALGMDVRFEENVGPLLTPVKTQAELDRLNADNLLSHLAPVYEALRLTRKALPENTTLIGFAGSPWTLACYIINGKGSRDFQDVRALATSDKAFFTNLLSLLCDAIAKHAIEQVKAGAEVIQLFDSWSGVLSQAQFQQWVIEPTRKIVSRIKAAHPDVPVIGFPRLAGCKVLDYVEQTGVDGVSIDGSVTLDWARDNLQKKVLVQGNLDPIVLTYDKPQMLEQAKKILESFSEGPFIFNLGHGVIPPTPIDHVQALCDLIRNHANR